MSFYTRITLTILLLIFFSQLNVVRADELNPFPDNPDFPDFDPKRFLEFPGSPELSADTTWNVSGALAKIREFELASGRIVRNRYDMVFDGSGRVVGFRFGELGDIFDINKGKILSVWGRDDLMSFTVKVKPAFFGGGVVPDGIVREERYGKLYRSYIEMTLSPDKTTSERGI
ncbi:MAG: hypothetical protein AABX29_06735, partial [Nanoarchaeota archaeon]